MKDSNKDMYKIGDTVIINKRNWKIVRVFPKERSYEVTLENPKPEDRWTGMYPSHSEITGKAEVYD